MLVFLSWSGERSKAVADALSVWLSQVIQAAEPWLSRDIAKGTRWGPEVGDRLEKTKVGIVCLTRENLDARWILFEAGALSKTKDAYVCTLLLGVKPSDVEEPLSQFQHTETDKEDIRRLLQTINQAVRANGEKGLSEAVLSEVFENNWPRIAERFENIRASAPTTTDDSRPDRQLFEEMLEILRDQERRRSHEAQKRRLESLKNISIVQRPFLRVASPDLLASLPDDLLQYVILDDDENVVHSKSDAEANGDKNILGGESNET